jgi:hypothetical protein
MARIRSIHPGVWTDEGFVSVSSFARLLFFGLLTECDDNGIFEWKPVQMKLRLMAADTVSVPELLGELEAQNMVRRYPLGESTYGAVRHFRQWQRPKKPNSHHPMTEEMRAYTAAKGESAVFTAAKSETVVAPVPPSEPIGGSPSPPVGNQFPTPSVDEGDEWPFGPEDRPQMEKEEGVGEEEEKKDSLSSLRSDDDAPKDEPPKKATKSPAPAATPATGTRLPEDWSPGAVGEEFARGLGINPATEFPRFRDYWLSKPGKDGRKTDWLATWRNWCRNAGERVRPGFIAPSASSVNRAPVLSGSW